MPIVRTVYYESNLCFRLLYTPHRLRGKLWYQKLLSFLKRFCKVFFLRENGTHHYFTSWHKRGPLKTKAVGCQALSPTGLTSFPLTTRRFKQCCLHGAFSNNRHHFGEKPQLLTGSSFRDISWGVASSRLTGSLKKKWKLTDVRSGLISSLCSSSISTDRYGNSGFSPRGNWYFIQL